MTLQYIRQLPGREADIGKNDDWTYRRSWLVQTDSRTYHEGNVLLEGISAGTFPTPYLSTHPSDTRFLCKRLTGRQERNSPLHWIVTAVWDTKPWDDDDEEDPLDRRAKISWSTIKYQKAVEKDQSNNGILNSAGDYFDPPPLRDISRWTATVVKNVSEVPSGILDWPDKLNADSWLIDGITVPSRCAKIMSVGVGDIRKEGDEVYRELSYTIEFDKEDLWKGKYLNQGYHYLTGGSPQNKKRCQVNNKDAMSPQLLDASGGQITNPTPADATFEEYDIYETMDFGILPVT